MLESKYMKPDLAVSKDEIIQSFKRIVISRLPNGEFTKYLEEQSNTSLLQLLDLMKKFKQEANIEEKSDLFKYLLKKYISFDISDIIQEYTENQKEQENYNDINPRQFRKFPNTFNTIVASTKEKIIIPRLNVTSIENRFTEFYHMEGILNRIFLRMNFYSKSYTLDFLTVLSNMLDCEVKSSQTTLNRFNQESSCVDTLINDPRSARIVEYISRAGDGFLNGLAKIQKNTLSLSNSVKEFLKLLLLSDIGTKLFPTWVGAIENTTKQLIVDDLLNNL